MNINQDTDFESLDIAILALMAAEDIQDKPVLVDGLHQLRRLQNEIYPLITQADDEGRKQQLLTAFYHQLNFSGNWQNYYAPENCLIEQVIDRRVGLPISLGIVLMSLAHAIELPVRGVCFPGNFLLRFPHQEQQLIDPFTGEIWNRNQQSLMLRATLGDLTEMESKYTADATHKQILMRLITVAKGCMLQNRCLPEALRCSEILLSLNPDDPYEVRDRGLVYEQLECPKLAAQDYAYFVEQCPQDPVAAILKAQIARLDSCAVTLH